jgi:glycosyltransferase involved in cell wall biosynthesis
MRIGIDARFWHSTHAGMSQYTKGLVKGLAKIDRQNEYLVFLRKKDLEEWDIGAPNFHPVVIDIPHYSFAEQLILPFLLRSYRLDLVHFANFNHPLLYWGKFTVTIHDLAYYFFPGRRLKGAIFKWGYYLTMWMAVRRARTVIAITQYVKEDIIRRFRIPARKIAVVYEGVDFTRFPKDKMTEEATAQLKRRLGMKWPVLFYVANWRVHKNHRMLLEAFRILREQGRDVQLLLGGQPTEELLTLIRQHRYSKDIIIAGFIPDTELAKYYALADVYVFPSLYEGFGLPLLEAQHMGVPVAASRSTTLPEVGGNSALYFDPLDAKDIALVASKILGSKGTQETLRRRGIKNLARFSWEQAARETIKVFQKVAHANH